MANSMIVKYESGGQQIELSPAIVKQYLVSGGGNVTDQEVGLFLKICEAQKLNPFIRESYLVKYGNSPASIIVGKDAFTKRAEANPNYRGQKSGIIVVNLKKELEYREGTFYLKDREELVGGWARVSFKDDKDDVFNSVSFEEYVGKKKDGTVNSQWATKPATMIKKVALVQALRDAFPSALGQLYIQDEMEIDDELPTNEVNIKEELKKANHVEPIKIPASKGIKQQIMQLASEKGLMIGQGKDADISKLIEICNSNGMNLKTLFQDEAEKLVTILMDYKKEEPKEEPMEEKQTESSEEVEHIDAEIVSESQEEPQDEDNPF